MNYKGFTIVNEPAYVWRMYCWNSDAGHNHIPCWYVYDAEGNKIAGGYRSGSNVKSGSADFGRAKEAKAFIDGYLEYTTHPERFMIDAHGFPIYKEKVNYQRKLRHGGSVSDEILKNCFENGFEAAENDKGETK